MKDNIIAIAANPPKAMEEALLDVMAAEDKNKTLEELAAELRKSRRETGRAEKEVKEAHLTIQNQAQEIVKLRAEKEMIMKMYNDLLNKAMS